MLRVITQGPGMLSNIVLNVVMPIAIMLSVIIQSNTRMSVVVLSFIMFSIFC
jgi:hypothetical protein